MLTIMERCISPLIRARIELTPTATRREDEIQSYLDLANDYSDEQIALCLERIGNRSHYPLNSLRVWIDRVLIKDAALPSASPSAWGFELIERAAKQHTEALKRFEDAHPEIETRAEALKSMTPDFPLPQDWLERLATLSWDEAAASGAEANLLFSQIWQQGSELASK